MTKQRRSLVLVGIVGALALLATPAWSHPAADGSRHEIIVQPDGDKDHNRPEHGSLGSIGAKLADPTANIWALVLNFQGPTFYDGDLNTGSPKVGGNVIFQPVMPIPLYGSGKDQWKLLTRPVIPIIFSQPIPDPAAGTDAFDHIGGLGDIELPLLLNPSARMLGHWIFAAGPVFEFPSATNTKLGANQYSVGPAVVLGYKTEKWTALVFPNYFFGIGSQSDRTAANATTSKLSLLYSFAYNLPSAWQVGINPTIAYNHNASSGNQWTVPVGLFVAKTIKLGGIPTKIEGVLEYAVVSPNAFGQRANFRILVTPVLPSLIQKSILGGN